MLSLLLLLLSVPQLAAPPVSVADGSPLTIFGLPADPGGLDGKTLGYSMIAPGQVQAIEVSVSTPWQGCTESGAVQLLGSDGAVLATVAAASSPYYAASDMASGASSQWQSSVRWPVSLAMDVPDIVRVAFTSPSGCTQYAQGIVVVLHANWAKVEP